MVGFSDITTLHTTIHNFGIASIYAAMPGGMKRATEDAKQSLYKALFGYGFEVEIVSNPLNKMGAAKAVLVGGNLSILNSMTSSFSEVNMNGKILFTEDVGEDLYRVDRMMYTLKRTKSLKNRKGIIVGDFDYNVEKDTLFSGTHREIMLNVVKDFNFPVLFDFPEGHITDNHVLIFGKEINIVVNEKSASVRC